MAVVVPVDGSRRWQLAIKVRSALECPLLANSGHSRRWAGRPLFVQERTFLTPSSMSAS